ncbi:hypothetical protein BV20DRAFT_1039659 [Pilatotrama ljubarskyi]|nr:hypothetical protein BV20DRAFT_1039659 [Pilatotrama ljubarskyi]
MVKLDARGYVSIAEIVIYVPILLVAIPVAFRHGFTRKAGWIFLVILSIIRIVGGVTHILSEQKPSNTTLQTIFSIMEATGLSPLLLATVGFLGTVIQFRLDTHALVVRGLRIMGVVGTVALILAVVGGVQTGDAKKQSDLNSATTFRHVGSILFAALYGATVLVTAFCWSNRTQILKYRRQLLYAVAVALPFLFVRVVYAVLSSFAPPALGFDANGHPFEAHSTSGLAKFSTSTGSWAIYLFMSVIMEYITVLIYTIVGIRTPLSKDEADLARGYPMQDGRYSGSEAAMCGNGYVPQRGGYA